MLTDDNADCADLDKSNAQVINGQFLTFVNRYGVALATDLYDQMSVIPFPLNLQASL